MLNKTDLLEVVHDQLFPLFTAERRRLEQIDLWYRWDHEPLKLPNRASDEHRWLAELSRTPWLGLVVTTVAQALYVDGYRSPDERDNSTAWSTWEANDFDHRQIAVHRAALAYGQAFVKVLPGLDGDGARSILRGVSPRRMIAVYQDPAEDEWPLFAMEGEPQKTDWLLRVYEDDVTHFVKVGSTGEGPEYIEWREHAAGVVPVVRYTNQLDLDGRADGDVEPFIGLAQRINKTTYDRLLTQHFNSWKIRTIAGVDLDQSGGRDADAAPLTPAEAQAARDAALVRLRQSDMLTAADPDVKFGTLDETPLEGFVRAYESDIETLAALAQVPATSLTGKVANLSAEAIAELRAGLTQKGTERQKSFGKSHAQALRLGAALEGDDVAAADFRSRVTWQDMEVRSLAQAADALGKITSMLGVPARALWGRIPGVEKADVDEWLGMVADEPAQPAPPPLLLPGS